MSDKGKVIAIIPARYGSTRFPGKPLALLWDKPMIQYTYEHVKRAKNLDAVYVATDDKRIMDVVHGFGGDVLMTRPELESGSNRCWEAVRIIENQHLKGPFDYVINIQGDEPLVDPDHIDLLVETLKSQKNKKKRAPMVALASKIKDEQDLMDHATTKVVIDQNDHALYFSRAMIPYSKSGEYHQDQIYYKNCGMYGFTRDFLDIYAQSRATPLQLEEDLEQLKTLEMGYPIAMAKVEHAALGIDYPEQLERLNLEESYISALVRKN